ncbi:MAG TPA: LysM peptidoglycan-binding domain-containing protein, partial [Cytophagaceae bacterium]
HLVRSGENLGRIADKYNIGITTLKKWNNIRGNNIKKGQKLIVYKEVISKHKTHIAAKTEAPKVTRSSKSLVHYVQPGDTLWTISRKYDGISIDKIRKLNKLKGNEIKIGQKLILG